MHFLATSKFSIATLANLGFVLTMIAYKIVIKVRLPSLEATSLQAPSSCTWS
jgi:hypothetical protein